MGDPFSTGEKGNDGARPQRRLRPLRRRAALQKDARRRRLRSSTPTSTTTQRRKAADPRLRFGRRADPRRRSRSTTSTSITARSSSSMAEWPTAAAPTSVRNTCIACPSSRTRTRATRATSEGARKRRAVVEVARQPHALRGAHRRRDRSSTFAIDGCSTAATSFRSRATGLARWRRRNAGSPCRGATVLTNEPNDRPNEIRELYLRLIGERERIIFIENPYFYHERSPRRSSARSAAPELEVDSDPSGGRTERQLVRA